MKRRTLLKGACCLGLGGLAADQWSEARGPHHTGRSCDPEAGPDEVSLRVPDPSNVKMLQFTDLHFFQRPWRRDLDRRTLDDMRRAIESHLAFLVDDGQEIPAELYKAVAQVLTFVYQLRVYRRHGGREPVLGDVAVDEPPGR